MTSPWHFTDGLGEISHGLGENQSSNCNLPIKPGKAERIWSPAPWPPPLHLSSFFILTDPCFCPHLQTTSLPFPQWPWEVRVAGSSHCCSLQEHIGVTGAQFYVAVLSSSGNQEHRRWSTCKWACGGLVYRKVADEGWGSIVVGLTRSLTSGYAGAEPVAVAGPWYTFKSLCWWTTEGLSSDGPVRQTWSARDLIPILLGLPLSVKQQH